MTPPLARRLGPPTLDSLAVDVPDSFARSLLPMSIVAMSGIAASTWRMR